MGKSRFPMLAVNFHAVLDYLWGSVLALFPYVMGFQGITAGKNFFLFLGVLTIFYSLLTDYRFSIYKIVPFGIHRIFDVSIGMFAAVAPTIFSYVQYLSVGQHLAHIILGAVVVGVAIFTRTATVTELLNSQSQTTGETVEDKPEERLSDVWAVLASIATIGLIVFLSGTVNQRSNQGAGQASKNWKFTAPSNPISQAPGGRPLPIERFIPKAQQGVDPAKATITINLETDPNIPAFNRERITVKRGEVVKLIFKNMSAVNHFDNFVLVRPGGENKVGEAGLRAGPDAGYIPVLPNEIIAHTKIIAPGETETIVFRAPSEPGLYPYISTFPKRWRSMHGIFEVK
jgi:azurin